MSERTPEAAEPVSTRLQALNETERELVRAALQARSRAHAPYSGFAVGAAALGEGQIVPGCNVESPSYGLTLCAERVCLFAARAAGVSLIDSIAVVGPGKDGRPTPPCGACRQVILDLAPRARVLLATPEGEIQVWSPSTLLPCGFGADHLEPST